MVTPVTLPMSGSESRLAVEVAELYPLQGQWTEQDYFAPEG